MQRACGQAEPGAATFHSKPQSIFFTKINSEGKQKRSGSGDERREGLGGVEGKETAVGM